MSRISYPAIETATGAAAEVLDQVKKAAGKVPNGYAAAGALTPAILKSILAGEAALAGGTLTKKDHETIKLLVSTVSGCGYCVAAHSYISKLTGLSVETIHAIRNGESTGEAKRDALIRFVRVVQENTGGVPQAEYDAIKAAGFTDAELIEISFTISLITFSNVVNRINDTVIDFPAV